MALFHRLYKSTLEYIAGQLFVTQHTVQKPPQLAGVLYIQFSNYRRVDPGLIPTLVQLSLPVGPRIIMMRKPTRLFVRHRKFGK